MKHRKGTRKQAAEYEFSIPERHEIIEFLRRQSSPCSLKQIAAGMGLELSEERAALNKRLKAMLRDGEIIKNRREGYGLVDKMDLMPGRVIGHPDGYGFFRPDTGGKDLFLPVKEMRSLLHGDRILAREAGPGRRNQREAAAVEILERANQRIVGRYFREGRIGYVVPDNKRLHQDVLIPEGKSKRAKSGQYVVAEIHRQPDRHTQPVGSVIEKLRSESSVEMATEIAIRAHEIPWQWPEEVAQESRRISMQGRRDSRRRDLRDLNFVTIDGEDAKDFDDAVFCCKDGPGWKLYVAIADVSSFVQPDTALDQEARERGTSVYFPQRVVPMLPEKLSNDLCSLKPGVPRHCLVCEMQVGAKGRIMQYRFYPAVIKSAHRLTYSETAAAVQQRDKQIRHRLAGVINTLDDLYRLYRIMHRQREKQGVLDFDTTETHMEFDTAGRISRILPLVRNDAHRLIEEFMLAANVSAANFLLDHKLPVLFRNHESPDEEKLAGIHEFMARFGMQLGGGEEPTARDYARLLDQVRSREDAHLLETVLLRSMALAVYEAENKGHFGLAFDAYTHFTSPIRRYPDLLVHRAIRHIIGQTSYPYQRVDLQRLGESCSMAERRAEEASRDVWQRLKCEYMQEHIGDVLRGTVSAVTAFGLFVELDDIFIEGLVHVTALPDDYYHYDAAGYLLLGEHSGKTFRLGDRILVKVVRVDVEDKKIDFDIASETELAGQGSDA